jgi:hypothetical protein
MYSINPEHKTGIEWETCSRGSPIKEPRLREREAHHCETAKRDQGLEEGLQPLERMREKPLWSEQFLGRVNYDHHGKRGTTK